jgi:hypothetical protein
VGVAQLSHVVASGRRLLHMSNMSAMGGVRGTRGSRFGKSSGGQTKDQNQIKDAFDNLSVHRFVSPRNHGFEKIIRSEQPVTQVIFTPI